MKKLFYTLITFSLFISCSSDDAASDNENIITNKTLKSYTLTSFPSQTTTSHYFDNNKGVNAIKNEKERFKFEYDTSDNLLAYTSFEEFEDAGTIEYKYEFNNDASGNITSANVSKPNALIGKKDYVMSFDYNGSKTTITYPFNDYDTIEIELEFNSQDLITSITKNKVFLIDSNPDVYVTELDYKEVFSYDGNNNCTSIDHTIPSIVGGENITFTYGYKYDDKANPLKAFHAKNYIPLLVIYFENFNLLDEGLYNVIRTFGSNNFTELIYPSSTPESSKFSFKNEYDTNGNLLKTITTNQSTGNKSVETIFNYD